MVCSRGQILISYYSIDSLTAKQPVCTTNRHPLPSSFPGVHQIRKVDHVWMPVVNKHQSDNLGPLSQLTLLAWHTSRKYIPMKTNVAVIIFKFFISFFCRSCLVVISMALSLNVKFMHGEMGVFYQEPRIQFYNVDYADLTYVKGVFETILVFWLNGNNTLKVSLWSAAI